MVMQIKLAVIVISEARDFTLFLVCSFLVMNELAKTNCEVKSERNVYSIFMLFTAN